jgi:hypothetical protein
VVFTLKGACDLAHFTRFVKWASWAVIASCLMLSVARGQEHEPPGKESHPSYLLYYGPGDGTVRLVDPESGNTSKPIYASSEGKQVWVHWFAYDWSDNRMYVIYSDNADGQLLVGWASPHSWEIKPGAVIDTTANFGVPDDFSKVQGLAYSQVTGKLYMNFATSPTASNLQGLIALDPESGKLALDLHFWYDFADGSAYTGHAISNDREGNIRYDFTESPYVAGLTTFRTYWLSKPEDEEHYQFSDILPVTFVGGDFRDEQPLSPPGWQSFVDEPCFLALATQPESGGCFVIYDGQRFPKGLSKLRFFSYSWSPGPDQPIIVHYAYAESINLAIPVASSGEGLSLVFVPWEIPESER